MHHIIISGILAIICLICMFLYINEQFVLLFQVFGGYFVGYIAGFSIGFGYKKK